MLVASGRFRSGPGIFWHVFNALMIVNWLNNYNIFVDVVIALLTLNPNCRHFDLTKFSSLASPKTAQMTTNDAASEENIAKMSTFSFQWKCVRHFDRRVRLFQNEWSVLQLCYHFIFEFSQLKNFYYVWWHFWWPGNHDPAFWVHSSVHCSGRVLWGAEQTIYHLIKKGGQISPCIMLSKSKYLPVWKTKTSNVLNSHSSRKIVCWGLVTSFSVRLKINNWCPFSDHFSYLYNHRVF